MPVKNLKVLSVLACLALTACAPGPHLHVNNAIFYLGSEIEPEMRDRNLIATVGYDEDFVGNYPGRLAQSTAYVHGAGEGAPERQLRAVYLTLTHLKGFAWYPAGKLFYSTMAAVPDSLGRLKAWDLVEYRSTGTYRTLENFATKQDGNIVVRVLCRRAEPDYEKCRDALPQVRNYPNGPTGTPYPASVKEYGYTFTLAYDAKGQPTRAIPEYVPAARVLAPSVVRNSDSTYTFTVAPEVLGVRAPQVAASAPAAVASSAQAASAPAATAATVTAPPLADGREPVAPAPAAPAQPALDTL